MARMKDYFRQHRPFVVLMLLVAMLTSIPILFTFFVLGSSWGQGLPPTFADETFYYARVQTIVKGHLTEGNPYFLEHTDGPPLVIFAGAWLNALPQLVGLSFDTSLLVNFLIWSLLFAATLYYLCRELRAPPWIAVFGTVLVYVQSYVHVWRAVNLQTVYPFYFLFYLALARLMREQNRKNMWFVGLVTGATFYLYAYLWQAIAITLGLLFFYALIKKNWSLLKGALLASVIGGVTGSPVVLYALWLSHSSPYFWESVFRLGLVNTHLPMTEVIYSGGWIGVVLVLLAALYWRTRALRADKEFIFLATYISMSGFGLWVMQGSNLITGKLLETGEHVKLLIFPWLVIVTITLAAYLWRQRALLSKSLYTFSVCMIALLSAVSLYYTYAYFSPFLTQGMNREAWQLEQSYVKPFAWLEQTEKNPVVVWSDPHDALATNLPIYTKDYTLYTWAGIMELVPEGEARERYLVSQYFNNPTVADFKSDSEMQMYLGRHDFPHESKTIERGIKLCRILYFWDRTKNCGTIPTPQSVLGDQFFISMENKFQNDIKSHIKAYLAKYHVSYIVKDKVLDPQYQPQKLGATRVYSDDRYEIYRL